MHAAHEQEEACLRGVLEAADEVGRCAEALAAAEEAARAHDAENAVDVDRMNREVGTYPSMVPVQIEKCRIFRTIFWVSIRENEEVTGSTVTLPTWMLLVQHLFVLWRSPLSLPIRV